MASSVTVVRSTMGKVHLDGMHKAGMTPVAVTELDKERLKVASSKR